MLSSSARAQGCPPRRASRTMVSGSSGIFRILRQNTAFTDMYSGGFYPYPTPEESWAYWSRYIFLNRYQDAPTSRSMRDLLKLVAGKDYFVITTNVDHCFQKAGFDKSIFSTRRATTACFSAVSRAVRRRLTTRQSFGKWSGGR